LRDQAREAWEDYLKIDSTSGWATEARSHLSALNSPPQSELFQQELRQLEAATKDLKPQAIVDAIRRWPDTAREWAEDQLLHQWPQLVTDGHLDDANVLATRVAPVADGLARERGDEFTKGVVTAVLAASDDQERTRLLAGAHMRYSSALKDYQEDRILQSAPQFESAVERLDGAGSPLAASSRLYTAIATYYAPDLTGALTQLQTLKDVAAARRYTRILGLTHRMIGLVHVVQGRLGAGLDEYRAALRCFQQVGDIDNEAGIRASIAETLDYIGERDTAWVERYAALSRLSAVEDPRRRHTILQGAAVAAVRQQMPEAALYFQHAALHNAIGWGRPPAIVNVRLNRAEVYTQLGSAHLAEQDLADAERLLATIEDPSLVARSEARILLARGQTMTEQAPGHAVDALDKALVYFKQGGGASWPLARAHLARGRAHVASAKDDIAEEDFQAGITVFERMRAALTSETLRSSYFEQPWDLFAEMVRLQAIRRQRPDRAIRFAEQARARTLLETAAPMSVPVDPGAVRNALPFGVTVIYYASLDDRLLTWVLTRSSLDFVDVPVRRADLSRLVDQYRDESALMRRGRNVPPLMALYDALVRPIRDKLAPGTRISVVPDGPLHAVPFAALLRREDTRYLIQDYAVSVTPSMTIFQLRDGRSPGDSRPMPEGALIVGNPNARDGSNVVVNLPGAQAEAAEIATLYRDSEVLVGPAATKARFLSALGKHAVVHFAGHAIPNEEFPGLSRLLLSADAAGDDTLFAHEIAAQRLDRTRLVVLAACRTNTGRIRRGEGVFSLARPFLAAGVQTVVASLSDVDDRASHRLFVAFHRALRQGQTPADALRSAQLAALAETDPNLQHSANWATFTIIGGLSAIANPGE
jgi:CHAT domain-containing protein